MTKKLTVEIVRVIKSGLRAKIPGDILAALYDVHPSTISLIKRGKRWQKVK